MYRTVSIIELKLKNVIRESNLWKVQFLESTAVLTVSDKSSKETDDFVYF